MCAGPVHLDKVDDLLDIVLPRLRPLQVAGFPRCEQVRVQPRRQRQRGVYRADRTHGKRRERQAAGAGEALEAAVRPLTDQAEVERRVLQALEARHFGHDGVHQVRGELYLRKLRQVVREQRQSVCGVRHGLVVVHDRSQVGPEEERRYTADCGAPGGGGRSRALYGALGADGADVHNGERPALRGLSGDACHRVALLLGQYRAFTGTAGDPETLDAVGHVVLKDRPESFLVDRAVRVYGCGVGREYSLEAREVAWTGAVRSHMDSPFLCDAGRSRPMAASIRRR